MWMSEPEGTPGPVTRMNRSYSPVPLTSLQTFVLVTVRACPSTFAETFVAGAAASAALSLESAPPSAEPPPDELPPEEEPPLEEPPLDEPPLEEPPLEEPAQALPSSLSGASAAAFVPKSSACFDEGIGTSISPRSIGLFSGAGRSSAI